MVGAFSQNSVTLTDLPMILPSESDPGSHTSNITLDRAKLIYGLVMQMNMNLGSRISGQISLIAQHDSSRLGFPTLITALCKARGVTSDSLTFESLSPTINLAYIKKNCWNLDDPSVTFWGTRKSRARGSEAPSTSAPPTLAPSTSAPSTSPLPPAPTTPVLPDPSSQSSEPFFSMLQSLHQGQLLIMQSLQNVVHQRPVVSVEEFIQQVAWLGVQPSPLGGGEASAAQESQQDQQEDIPEVAEPTPPKPFTLESDLVVVQVQEDVTASKPSPSEPFIF